MSKTNEEIVKEFFGVLRQDPEGIKLWLQLTLEAKDAEWQTHFDEMEARWRKELEMCNKRWEKRIKEAIGDEEEHLDGNSLAVAITNAVKSGRNLRREEFINNLKLGL